MRLSTRFSIVLAAATCAGAQQRPTVEDQPVWAVVATDGSMLAPARPLVEDRRRRGFRVIEIETGVDPRADVENVLERVGVLLDSERTGYLLIIGDDPVPTRTRPGLRTVAKQYALGADPVDSDAALVDRDDDGAPDWSVGRIPVSTPEALSIVVDKILGYESRPPGAWQREVALVANSGNFGEAIDAMLENAVNRLFREHLDPTYRMCGVVGMAGSPFHTEPGAFLDAVLDTLDAGPFAMVYAGHGQRSRFAPLAGKPVLRVRDVERLEGQGDRTVLLSFACHVAKYRGGDCLGEVLLRSRSGPCAVFAASDVSFPYGDALLGYELLRALRSRDGELRLGDLVRAAKRALIRHDDSEFGEQADTLANLTGLDPETRAGLRRYTADLYHVLGDPAMTLRLPRPLLVELDRPARHGESLRLRIGARGDEHPKRITVELCVDRGKDLIGDPKSDVVAARVADWSDAGVLEVELPVIAASGRFASVRVFGQSGDSYWAGGLRFRLERRVSR